MSKRLNASKIAKQPLLKKNIARFLAKAELTLSEEEFSMEEMLFSGHRGFISYNEKDLVKLLERWASLAADRARNIELEREAAKTSNLYRWTNDTEEKAVIQLAKEGNKLLNDLMDEILLS